jgi:transposase
LGTAGEDGAGTGVAGQDRAGVRGGATNKAVAEQLGIWPQTVTKWRGRFVRGRLQGLSGEDRPGRPRTITDTQVEQVITKTLEEPPPRQDTHWSTRSMARRPG